MADFASLYERYPTAFKSQFWKEIQRLRVIVEDQDSSIYPKWFHTLRPPASLAKLRNPIELVRTLKPPSEFNIFYSDSAPNFSYSPRPGPGTVGVVWVTSDEKNVDLDRIESFGVFIPRGSVFKSEGNAMLAGMRLAVEKGLKHCYFVSDCKDLTDALTGGGYTHVGYADTLLSELKALLDRIPEAVVIHSFREGAGVSLCDEIAYFMRKEYKGPKDEMILMSLSEKSKEIIRLEGNLKIRFPGIRFTYLSHLATQRMCPRTTSV